MGFWNISLLSYNQVLLALLVSMTEFIPFFMSFIEITWEPYATPFFFNLAPMTIILLRIFSRLSQCGLYSLAVWDERLRRFQVRPLCPRSNYEKDKLFTRMNRFERSTGTAWWSHIHYIHVGDVRNVGLGQPLSTLTINPIYSIIKSYLTWFPISNYA